MFLMGITKIRALAQTVEVVLAIGLGRVYCSGCVWAAESAKGKNLPFLLQENVRIPVDILCRIERVR